jgi:hypothetical protein
MLVASGRGCGIPVGSAGGLYHRVIDSGRGWQYPLDLMRYADDFIISGNSREPWVDEVKPLMASLLETRGLELSPEKTRISRPATCLYRHATGTQRPDQREPGIAGSLWSPTGYGCDESACASPTMTFAPAGRPKVPPLVTITWMARTVSPLVVVAEQVTGVPVGEHAGAPAPSQTCSFRTTETLGITLMQVLAGGLS